MAGSLLSLYQASLETPIDPGFYNFTRVSVYQVMNVYAVKMAGVFMIVTSTMALRTGISKRWMAFLGIALAVALLLSIGTFYWILLVFPLWVLTISIHILLVNLSRTQTGNRAAD